MAFSISESINSVKNGLNSVSSKISGLAEQAFPTTVTKFKFSDVSRLDRPAPSWRWNITLPKIQGKSLPGIFCENVDVVSGISIPRSSKYFQGIELAFPGIPSYEIITATFYEPESYQTTDYFTTWTSLIFNPIQKIYGVPKDYGQTVVFSLLPIVEPIETWATVELGTCWPLNLQRLSFGSTTDRIKVQVDFAFHSLDLVIVGASQPPAGSDAATLLNKFSNLRR